MMMCEDRELLDEFLTEATELLEKIDDDLVALERFPGDTDILNRVFRSIHTVKGAASFLELELLVKVTHDTEDVLNRLRRGELALTPEIMDLVLEAVALVRALVNDIKEGELRDRPVDHLIDRLSGALAQGNDADAPGGAEETGAPAESMPLPMPAEDRATPSDAASSGEGAPQSGPGQPPPGKDELADKATVRVDVKRIDDLMNQVGELVLERNRMVQLTDDYRNGTNVPLFGEEIAKLTKRINFVTSELQMQVLKMRLIPVGNVFRKFPRIVRNIARDVGKKVELLVHGEETELDRSVVDEIGDPLIHLVRNALDHGLETPEERVAAGKPASGAIVLSAHHEGNRIIISIKDDGRGIDCDRVTAKAVEKGLITPEQVSVLSRQDIFSLIFLPGFSTRETATDLSGRGVGMDVVRTNIEKLNGIIEIRSETGKGSEFILKLPLTLAIIQSLLVEASGETYAVPLSAVMETLRIKEDELHSIGGGKVLQLRDTVIPLVNLSELFDVSREGQRRSYCYVVVLGVAERRVGLVVSRLMGQQEVAIKSLGNYLGNVAGIAGSTIMGDGRVALIIDPSKLVGQADKKAHPGFLQHA